MGNLCSRTSSCCIAVCQWLLGSRPRAGGPTDSDSDSDDVEGGLREGTANGATPKRRALLVGISYEHSPCDEFTGEWEVLDGTHKDVEYFRKLLISAYSQQHLAGVTSFG